MAGYMLLPMPMSTASTVAARKNEKPSRRAGVVILFIGVCLNLLGYCRLCSITRHSVAMPRSIRLSRRAARTLSNVCSNRKEALSFAILAFSNAAFLVLDRHRVQASPQIPHRDRAPGAPLFSDRDHFVGLWAGTVGIVVGDRFLSGLYRHPLRLPVLH